MQLDVSGLSQGQQLAAEVDQIMSIRLLNRLKSPDVGTKVSDIVTLLGVLGFESVDVYSLSSELVAEGILAVLAAGESGGQLGRRFAVGGDRGGLGNGIPESNGPGGIWA